MRLLALPIRRGRWLPLLLLVACHPGFGRGGPATPAPAAPRTAASPASATPPLVDGRRIADAGIYSVASVTNGIEMSYARLALAQAIQPEVVAYARRMMTEHALLHTQLRDMSTRLEVVWRDDPLATGLRDASVERRDLLRTLQGRSFDTTFIRIAIEQHRQLVDLIDRVLLPSVGRDELRQYLVGMRPAVNAHIVHAEQVRATIATRQ
jgi:putative membrane protein